MIVKRAFKKLVTVGLSAIMAVGIIPALGTVSNGTIGEITTEASTGGKNADDAISWVSSQVGKALDYDGAYGAQCVDLIMYYYAALGVSPVSGNGSDYTWNALPGGWQRLQGVQPKKGDVLIYTGGTYGHVAIYESDYVTYHQNWNGSMYVRKLTYAYNNSTQFGTYWGVIRPDFPSPVETGSEMSVGYSRTIPDGDYLIATAASSDKTKFYYLDIYGTALPAKAGDNVDLAGPTGGDVPEYEIWTVKYSNGFYTIMQKGTNMSLDVFGIDRKNGANIGVSTYNGGSNQKWAISQNGKNGYKIQAKHSGYCVDVTDCQIKTETNIQQCKDNGSDAQSWLFIPYKPTQTLEDGRYVLLSAMSNNIELDIPGDTGDIEENTNVQIWSDTAQSQYNAFDIKKLSNGYYSIKHSVSGKALDLTYALSAYDANVALHTANNSVAQQWAITKDGANGGYVLRVKCSGYALDIDKAKTDNGTNVRQCPINYGKNQTWVFVPAEYIISYDANAGSNAPDSQIKYYKADISFRTEIPTRKNYTFAGWNTSADGTGESYASGDIYKADKDLTLYAQWKSTAKKQTNPLAVAVSEKTYNYAKLTKAASFSIGASNAQGKVTYTPDAAVKKANIKVTAAGKVTVPKNCPAGTYKITVKATGNSTYAAGSKTVTVRVTKAANTMKIKTSSKKYKRSSLAKAKSFSIGTSKAIGKVTYTPNAAAKKEKIKVTAKGKVTVPKKCKKGTYKITVKAAGNSNYKAGKKTVKIVVN